MFLLLLLGGRPKHVVMTAFLGTKVAAIGRVAAFGWTKIPGTATAGTFHSALPPLRLPDDARMGSGKLTFRPESVRIGAAPENTLTTRVLDRIYLGTQTRLRLSSVDGIEIDPLLE